MGLPIQKLYGALIEYDTPGVLDMPGFLYLCRKLILYGRRK